MAVLKCKMCGGDLQLTEGCTTAECEYCGSIQTVPQADDDKKMALFARANRLRYNCEFDKASGVYETIVADFPEEAEAYWGLVLCKYGIEYVDDPATGKKIPTCHRSSFDSVMKDPDFELAQENADSAARRVYREEAKAFEELRKGIIAVSANEQPYDIFICYKETDEKGNRTLDSVLAQDMYDALTDRGYRTFFARISLEDKLGVEYEPYIFAALNSAKIMLAVGTDYEFYNAVWVKNEWSRFLKLMVKDKEKHLIPCYKNIDAYDIPDEFAKFQAQDLGKVGALQDLLRGIEKLMPRQKQEEPAPVQPVAGDSQIAPLLERVFMFLEDGEWENADEYCEKVLDKDPKCGEAYLGKMMAQLRVPVREQLQDQQVSFDNNRHFVKAMRFGDASLKALLQSCRNAALDRHYNAAVASMEQAQTEQQFHQVAALFDAIRDHRDAGAKAEQCRANAAEVIRREEERKAEEARQAAEAVKRTQKMQSTLVGSLISAGDGHTVALRSDGTVLLAGTNYFGQNEARHWSKIVAVSDGNDHTVGLKQDGTVVAAGNALDDRCDVEHWKNIRAISAGGFHTVGLKQDGTVVATGMDTYEQCDVYGWNEIAAVSAGGFHTVGLKKDGTVVAAGMEDYYQCDVGNWKNIVYISAGGYHTVGLKADGTAVAVGFNDDGRCNVESWQNVVAVSAGSYHTVGLRLDGTVVAAGNNEDGQCDVEDWQNIVAVCAGESHTIGLRADGTLVATGDNEEGQCNVHTWRLFESLKSLEQKRENLLELARRQLQWQREGRCRHCGGELTGGLLGRRCILCGMKKDY